MRLGRFAAVAGCSLALVLAACGDDSGDNATATTAGGGGAGTSAAAARRRRLRRRRVVEQLPGRALGEVRRARDQGSGRGRRRQLHLERREVVGRDAGQQRREPHLAGRQRARSSSPRTAPPSCRPSPDAIARACRSSPTTASSRTRRRSTSRSTTSRSAPAGRGDLRPGAEGQLRDHQGQQGRRQRRLPAQRHGRGHR